MAILVGNPFGEMRGKLGGMVFTAVRGRKVVRAYSIPVQPNTDAQLTARASFGAASQSYHGLSDLLKANWSSYAAERFNAKDSYNQGQYSGANAFVSLRNAVNMSARLPLTMNYENDAGVALDGSAVPFAFDSTPPGDQLAANVKGLIVGEDYPISVDTIVLMADGTFDVRVNFDGAPVGGVGQDDLVDQSGNVFGFAVYVSNVINQDHNYVSNSAMQCLGIMPSITGGTTVKLGTETGVHIVNSVALDLSKYKSFGQEGDQVEVKVYQVSKKGMYSCNGAKRITISPTP